MAMGHSDAMGSGTPQAVSLPCMPPDVSAANCRSCSLRAWYSTDNEHVLHTAYLECLPTLGIALLYLVYLSNAFCPTMGQFSGASVPVSATLADLVNDPQGRGHLLVSHSCVARSVLECYCPCSVYLIPSTPSKGTDT